MPDGAGARSKGIFQRIVDPRAVGRRETAASTPAAIAHNTVRRSISGMGLLSLGLWPRRKPVCRFAPLLFGDTTSMRRRWLRSPGNSASAKIPMRLGQAHLTDGAAPQTP